MAKDAFHQAVVGGLSLGGVLTADGPAVVGHRVRGGEYAGGVALVVSGLRRFVPEHFGKGPGSWDWYIVKYRSEARLHLAGFTAGQVQRMRDEFGLLPIDEQDRPESAAQAFHASRTWASLVRWVGQHPRVAKRMSRFDAYLPGWYDHACTALRQPEPWSVRATNRRMTSAAEELPAIR